MAQQENYRIDVERPTDDEITSRKKLVRIISVTFFSTLIILAPTIIFGFWGSMLDHRVTGLIIGLIIGLIALAFIAPKRMFIYNPEWCGYVTQDMLKGTMVAYGPGLHASYWWEQRNAEGNYSLEVKTQPFIVDVVTGTAKVTISGEYEYAIDLGNIELAIGVSVAVVENGITAFIKNSLTELYAEVDAKVVQTKIEEMGEHLSSELMNKNGTLAVIRNKYGYKTVSIVVDRIAIPKAAQETRDALDEADALFEVVAKLHGRTKEQLIAQLANGEVKEADYQKMLTRAMAVAGNKTTVDVKVIEGLESSPAGAVAATLSALSPKGGDKK